MPCNLSIKLVSPTTWRLLPHYGYHSPYVEPWGEMPLLVSKDSASTDAQRTSGYQLPNYPIIYRSSLNCLRLRSEDLPSARVYTCTTESLQYHLFGQLFYPAVQLITKSGLLSVFIPVIILMLSKTRNLFWTLFYCSNVFQRYQTWYVNPYLNLANSKTGK